jgi:predicted nucleotidyltransferase
MPAAPFDIPACEAARALLERHPAIDAAYMLGSAAAGRLRPDSDVDIAILARPRHMLSVPDRLALGAELSSIFTREVDLGVLTPANVVYAKEAVTHGRLIFARDRATAARFAMHTLSMYAALQEARREVLRAYAA